MPFRLPLLSKALASCLDNVALVDRDKATGQFGQAFYRCFSWDVDFHRLRFLPRGNCGFERLARREMFCADENLVRQALAENGRRSFNEARYVVRAAVVEAINLLVEVAEQMERLNGDVGCP